VPGNRRPQQRGQSVRARCPGPRPGGVGTYRPRSTRTPGPVGDVFVEVGDGWGVIFPFGYSPPVSERTDGPPRPSPANVKDRTGDTLSQLVEQLRMALSSRVTIEQAKEMLPSTEMAAAGPRQPRPRRTGPHQPARHRPALDAARRLPRPPPCARCRCAHRPRPPSPTEQQTRPRTRRPQTRPRPHGDPPRAGARSNVWAPANAAYSPTPSPRYTTKAPASNRSAPTPATATDMCAVLSSTAVPNCRPAAAAADPECP
jgi:hypothetical protein